MPLTQRPLTASVTITKSGTNYFNSTTAALGANEFRLLRGSIKLSGSNKASAVMFEIEDNSEKWFSTFTVGSSVAVKLGKLGSTFTSIFVGVIERTAMERVDANNTLVRLEGVDQQWKLMETLVLNYERGQQRNTNTTLNTAAATAMLVTDIIIDLMNSTDETVYLNGVNSGIAAASTGGGGLIVGNTGVSIPFVHFNYKPLHDCLKELFDYLRYDWGVDKDGKLYGRPLELASDSGVTLDTSTITQLVVEDDITEMKNVAFVIGADEQVALDGTTSPTSGTMNTSSLYLAQKFTATTDNLGFVQIYIQKVGDPPNLNAAVYTDQSNKPSNTPIIYAALQKDVIGASPAWHQFEVNQQVVTGQPYWIVLFREPSASPTTDFYRWHTNGGSNATTATATDSGASVAAGGWSTVGGTSSFIYNLWYQRPALGWNIDVKSTSTYGVRQVAERQGDITNRDDAFAWAKGLVNVLGRKKQTLQITAVSPDAILEPGKRVTVSDVGLSATSYLMTDVEYDLVGHESYYVRVNAMRFVQA